MNIRTLASLSLLILLVSASGCRKQASAGLTRPQQQASQQETPKAVTIQPELATQEPPTDARKGNFVMTFGGINLAPQRRDPNVNYTLDPNVEQFFVHVPEDYSDDKAYGLIVFVDADSNSSQLPAGWQTVLDSRRYLYIAPHNAGNNQNIDRRLGLAVLGALEMVEHYRVDPNRIYAAGFSGGSRMAGLLGFAQGDVFRGTIQNCGADFYKPVPVVSATTTTDTAGNPYGLFQATDDEISIARRVRFIDHRIKGFSPWKHRRHI